MKGITGFVVAITLLLQSCEIYIVDNELPQIPKCEIVSMVKVNGNYSTPPKFRIVIENYVKNSIAYDIACEIEMRVGNLVVDRAYADFGKLFGAESAVGEAYIPNLVSHSYYTEVTLTLSWFDDNGNYFEKVYYY